MSETEAEDLEEKILYLSRHGNSEELLKILQENLYINVNCKGKSKSNKSWTPLQLASYFGHLGTVEILLNHGADPNILNQTGDTALHKASLTSRGEVVLCLLNHDASTSIINDECKRASQIACDAHIKNTLEAAEKVELLKKKEKFLQAVKEGRVNAVKDMINQNLISVNVCDELGNTALHHAAMRDQRAMTVALLQCGADAWKTNKEGEKALDLCRSQQMKKLLEVRPLRQIRSVKRFEGPLMKRKRFLGPKWHWVVLEKGVMSYFARRADAATGSKRKMFRYLTEASISARDENHYGLVVCFFDGSHHNLMVHQKNNPLINRQKWVDAIREHAEYSNHFVVADHVVIESDIEDDDPVTIVDIKNSVQNAQVHHHVLKSHIDELTSIVRQFVANENNTSKIECQRLSTLVLGKCHKVLATSSEMTESFGKCLAALEQHDQGFDITEFKKITPELYCEQLQDAKARDVQIGEEREKNRVLEQALQALATEHHNLERTISSQGGSTRTSPTKAMPASPDDEYDLADSSSHDSRHLSNASKASSSGGFLSDEDEFYDAVSGDSEDDTDSLSLVEADYDAVNQPDENGDDALASSPTTSHQSRLSDSDLESNGVCNSTPSGGHRTRLPVTMFSRDEFSIWHILRQCIGKELSKITMPVIFNEPLSFIQRLCEYMEYSCLLEKACAAEDSVKRMEYVAAFAVSALASQLDRLGKPFNPLLGETYEYQRDDLGFNWVSEQVSHHPPVSAFHAKGTNPQHPFTLHGSIYPKLKFWGKSVEVEPKGTLMLHLTSHDETYTWTNPKCSVHNIVVGKLWMEQHGVMEIVNHKTNEKCVVTFKSYSWFRNDLNKVEGYIYNNSKEVVRVIHGDWTRYVYSMGVGVHEKFVELTTNNGSSGKKSRSKSQSSSSTDDVIDILANLSDEEDCDCLWRVQSRPAISAEMYNMTQFAMSLNESEVKGYDLPPTDCRLRPDIRLLENGDIDGASEAKHVLEEKQRTARKLRHKKKAEWTPRWFAKMDSPFTKSLEWTFNDQYTRRDWSNCPDIF